MDSFDDLTLEDLDHPMVTRWAKMAEGKLVAEGLSIDSPMDEIERCFAEVVCPELCIALVRLLREKMTEMSKEKIGRVPDSIVNTVICGECSQVMAEQLPNNCIDLTVTSPPY